MESIMYNAVKMVCDTLTDAELTAINNVAQWGADPRGVTGYEKASSLFTEEDHTKMHASTREALARVVVQRLAPGAFSVHLARRI